MRDQIVFYLNGARMQVGAEHAMSMLADYLRQERGLTGTKIVCAEGDCGACTVLRQTGTGGGYLPVNSCILTLGQLDGASLVTVDALATAEGLHPVQRAMVECHGSQCGFCTPGFVMALAGLVEKKKSAITAQDAKNATTGNLCRCTGYQPIIDAACAIPVKQCLPIARRFKAPGRDQQTLAKGPVRTGEFFAPTTLREAITHLKKHPRAQILAGGTDLGVLHNKRKARLEQVVSLHRIPELREIRETRGVIRVGAQATLSELREFCKKRVPELARFLDLFASPQIKNAATLAGNVANASPIGDTPPFLLAMDATLCLQSSGGKRKVKTRDFFRGYRKTSLRATELITAIEFKKPARGEILSLRKVSQRKDLDISAVSAAFRVTIQKGIIQRADIAYGGVAATPLYLKKTSRALVGRKPGPETTERALEALHSEITPLADLRGSAAFRRVVAENLLTSFVRSLIP